MKQITLAISGLFIILAASGCKSSKSSLDPAALLEERCGSCHSTDIPKNARKAERDWDETVTRMVAKGARLSPEEQNALVRHLAKLYRP